MDDATKELTDEDIRTVMPGSAETGPADMPRDPDGTDRGDGDDADDSDSDDSDSGDSDSDSDGTDTRDADGTDTAS
jgi:hypothetical protein